MLILTAVPFNTTPAYGASTVLVGGESTQTPNAVFSDNLISLTPTVISVKQPIVTITIVQSVYQQQQAALAAQQAAQAAAQAAAERAAALKEAQIVSSERASREAASQVSDTDKVATVQKAAATFGINWKVLAAVWQVESGSQWVTSEESSAGAVGPCQFLPSTWASYAYDGDGNGSENIDDASDCLYGAAKLLASNGAASGDNVDALLHYNHSMDYVDRVLSIASEIQG